MNPEQFLKELTETTEKLKDLRRSQAYQALEEADEFRATNLSLDEVADALLEIQEMILDMPYIPIYKEIDALNSKQLAGLAILIAAKVHRETMASLEELHKTFGYFDVPETLISAIANLFDDDDYRKLSGELMHKLSTFKDVKP